MKEESIDKGSSAHTKWDCKYHIVFAPKYRRKVFFEENGWRYGKSRGNYANGRA